MADFATALVPTLKREGGFVNDPDDSGGMTYRGISRKNNKRWVGWPIVDAMLEAGHEPKERDPQLEPLVVGFYLDQFWTPMNLDSVNSQRVASYIFDLAVNSGKRKAIECLQEVLGVKVDGQLGPITLSHINATDPDDMIVLLTVRRCALYWNRVAIDKMQRKFLLGWGRRGLGL